MNFKVYFGSDKAVAGLNRTISSQDCIQKLIEDEMKNKFLSAFDCRGPLSHRKGANQWRKQRRGKKREQPVLQNSSDSIINLYTEAGKSVEGSFSFSHLAEMFPRICFCFVSHPSKLHKYTHQFTVRRSYLIGKQWSCKKWRWWTQKCSSAFISSSFTTSPPVHLTFLLHLCEKKRNRIRKYFAQQQRGLGQEECRIRPMRSKRVLGHFKRLCEWWVFFFLLQ